MNTTKPVKLSSEITLQELIDQYRMIAEVINSQWPIESHDKKVLARTLKMMEELGELSDEILTSMQLQRKAKVSKFDQNNLNDEFADVLACVILLGVELGIDIEEVMHRKISMTHERLAQEIDASESKP